MGQHWFKQRRFGWGWTPASPEGWIVTLAFVAYMLWLGFYYPVEENIGGFYFRFVFAIVLLLIICWKTGEKPEWNWGFKSPPRP